MKSKELKGKYGRPDWNPAVLISFTGTKCLKINIEKAVKEMGIWSNEDEFIRYAVREKLEKLGMKKLIEPPTEELGE